MLKTMNERLKSMAPSALGEIVRYKKQLIAEGKDIIDFSVGDPDFPSPPHAIDRICKESLNSKNHKYPIPSEGLDEFRRAMAYFYKVRFGVTLDTDKEIQVAVGTKEIWAHLMLTLLEPGDVCIMQDPSYPTYKIMAMASGADIHYMSLTTNNNFVPDLEEIPEDVRARATLMCLNYPNNPTGGVVDLDFLQKAVDFCRKYEIVLAYDNAYSEITYDGFVAPSVLQIRNATDIAIESFPLSKSFSMAGWRIGAMVGNAEVLKSLRIMKSNIDFGPPAAIQLGAATALTEDPLKQTKHYRDLYEHRRNLIMNAFRSVGMEVPTSLGCAFLWIPIPEGHTDESWAKFFLKNANVMFVPGGIYGKEGKGFIRISLTVPDERIQEAMERIKKIL